MVAKMLGKERVQKVVIASSGVNMTMSSNTALVQSSEMESIDDLMLPTKPHQLRKLMSLSIYNPPPLVPDFMLKAFIDVTSLFLLSHLVTLF